MEKKMRTPCREKLVGQCEATSDDDALIFSGYPFGIVPGRFLVSLLACALMSCGSDTSANASNAAGAQPMNSAAPAAEAGILMPEQEPGVGFTRLGGPEIRNRLSGHMLMPDRRIRQFGMEFAEDFLPDGAWVSRRNERAITVRRGVWRVVGDQLCVTVSGQATLCRHIWSDRQGRIAMRDMRTSIETILIMTASPISADASDTNEGASSIEGYAARHLPGPGRYTNIVIWDRLIRDPSGELSQTARYWGADRLVVAFIRQNVRPGVRVSTVANFPPATWGTPAGPGGEVTLLRAPANTIYIGLTNLQMREVRQADGRRISEVVPAVGVWGDERQLGLHHTTLSEPAPGDTPCPDFCRTPEEAFAAVRGRIDLIIRNIKS